MVINCDRCKRLIDLPSKLIAITGEKGSGKAVVLHFYCGLNFARGGRVITYTGDDLFIPDGKEGT